MADVPVQHEAPNAIDPGPGATEDNPEMDAVAPAGDTAGDTDDTVDAGDEPVEPEPDNHFANDTNHIIEHLVSSTSASALEDGVRVGLRVIKKLKAPLEEAQRSGHTEAGHWLRCMEQLEGDTEPPRTVVGVM